MKLESTLPEQPGFLHVVPLLNLFALLLAFEVMGSAFMLQSGVSVELPPSRFQMERFVEPLVITVTAGETPAVFVGHERVALDQLGRRLEVERRSGDAGSRMAVLRVDSLVPAAVERQIAEMALTRGFRVVLAGEPGLGGVRAGEDGSGGAAAGEGPARSVPGSDPPSGRTGARKGP